MNMQSSFQIKVKQQLEYLFQDINVDFYIQPAQPLQQLYSYSPHPHLSIPELRYIVEQQSQLGNQESHLLANKILYFINNLIRILENNEQCRINWTGGISKGRFQTQNKISLSLLELQVNELNQLIQECKHGATSKSEMRRILQVKRKQIFLWKDHTKFIRNIKEIILPEMPEILQNCKMLNQDTYLIQYQSIIQRLLIYQNAMNQYLQNRLSFQQFQQICSELMRQDILIGNNKTNEVIKYTWYFCNDQLHKYNKLRNRIFKLRNNLINSIIRVYYICFICKMDIEQLQQSLAPIQNYLIHSSSPYISGANGINLGRNSIIVEVNEDKIIYLQDVFNNIFAYLTDNKETVFTNLYERKLKKRVYKLTQIENKLTHLYKIKFNPDYAQKIRDQKQTLPNRHQFNFQDHFNKLINYYSQVRPVSENQFRVIFQELQRIILLRDKSKHEQQYKILQFEKILLNQYLFNEKGERKLKKQGPMQRFTKSVVNDNKKINNMNFNHYQVKKQQVFQETIDQLNRNGYHQINTNHNQIINANQAFEDGKQYILSIRPQFGQQFMDLINFRAYLLPKIQRQAQIAYSQTPYSVQPLYLQLTSLLEHLNLIIQIIRPDINEKKIDLIFFPKVNSLLFTVLKTKMLENQQKLNNIYFQLKENAIKANTLQANIKQFIENRVRYLYVLLQNIDKLQEIAINIGQLNLIKSTYDITSQITYNIVLKLLLAQKQIKAYQLALRDRINDKTLSQKGIKLLAQYIYPNFINSLLIVFECTNNQLYPQSLENLLNIAEESRKMLQESDRCLDSIIKISQGIMRRQISRNIIQALQSFRMTLSSYFSQIENLINKSNSYNNISSQALAIQRLRIFQFMEICEYGPNLKSEILDERSKYLLNILKIMGV